MFKNIKRSVAILGLAFFVTFNTSYAEDSVKDLKNKKKATIHEMNEKKKQVDGLSTEAKKMQIELDRLNQEISIAKKELDQAEKDIASLSKDIDKTEEELRLAEEELEEQQEIFGSRLRVMYKNGNVGYLEILLSSNDMKDFLSRKQMIQSIAKQDIEIMEIMEEQKATIDRKEKELRSKRSSMEDTKLKLDEKREELELASEEQKKLKAELDKELNQAEAELDKLNKLADDIESEIKKRQSGGGVYTGGKMSWPVPGNYRISSPFGYRTHPIYKTKKLHTGIDIPAPTGNDVLAAAGGRVIFSGNLGGYGKTVMVDHGGGIVTLYAHNSSLTVSEGASVAQGDLIAKIGSTGASTGPHSHFEVRKNGSYVNPVPWVKGN